MKRSRLIQKAKRFMAGVIALAMTVTMFPVASAAAEEPQEKYPYTLFAASEVDGAITIIGNACVNGNIATNGTAVVTGSAINVNGSITEQVNEKMINISAKIDELYFAGENVENYAGNYVSEDVNCNISNPTVVRGTMEVKGNVNLNAPVKVSENITLQTEDDTDRDGILDDVDPERLVKNMYIDLGSSEYMADMISRFEESDYMKNIYPYEPLHKNPLVNSEPKEYYDTLIDIMIADINSSDLYYLVSDENWERFCSFFNHCMIRGNAITPKKHYIRNKLNRAPETLREMFVESEQWILCEVDDSAFHMYGEDGGYNLKFISLCGKYEAVYDKNGELLTEHNNPTNMGTYNYVNYKVDAVAHGVWDVIPYELYGNTSSCGAKLFPDTKEYDSNESAQKYRQEIISILESNMELDEKVKLYDEIFDKYCD